MRIKKYAAAFLAATTVLGSLAACGEKEPAVVDPVATQDPANPDTPVEPTDEPEPEGPKATPIPDRDLGGAAFIIGDHWSPDVPAEPKNAQEEATQKYRQEIFAKYNFTMQSKTVAGWGEMTDTCVQSITAGEPAANIFELDYRFVAQPMANGLFYDLATLDEFDFTEDKWNKAVLGLMTVGDSIYGMRAGKSEPRGGVIWNKRLFEEAGLDPNLPYDLQAKGEWTWSKFEELCAQLTRDTNNDGVTDIYATVSQGAEAMNCLALGCGQDYVMKDENGKLYNNTTNKQFLDAIDFAVKLYNAGYEMPQPEGSEWDYFQPAFQEGKAAMQFNQEYMCQPGQMYGDAMEDAVGFVMPPKPDGQESYKSYVCDNIAIIPSCYTAEQAGDIAFAYNVYTMATPGYDDPNDWKEQYYLHFEDERAVDETIVMFNDGVSTTFLNQTLVAGLDAVIGPDFLWQYPFANVTPADQAAAVKDSWDAIIAEANK